MEFSQEIKDSIKNNMLHITTVMKKKPRNYLNKQLQDAVCNYFLENYAAPFLKEEYQIVSGRELRKKIEKALPAQGKKYINLLNKFKSEIQRVNKGDEYRQMLSSMVSEEEKYEFETEEWCTLQRKKILALLLIVHWDEENILNFYDMWNSLYPTDPLIKQKLSKEEKEKQKKQAKNLSSSSTMASSTNSFHQVQAPVDCYNRMNYSCDSYSQESSVINSKRSSSSFIAQSIDVASYTSQQPMFVQQQPQVVYFQQQQQQQSSPKRIINNRIFEDDYEEEQQQVQQDLSFNVKVEYPQTKIRVCETIDIMPRVYHQQQQQYQYQFYPQQCYQNQNFCAAPAQPVYANEMTNFAVYNGDNCCQQQQQQQQQQENNYQPITQQDCASSQSLEEHSLRSESMSSGKNSQIMMGTSQMCSSDDSYSLKNEYTNDEFSNDQIELYSNVNNNTGFSYPAFMNENMNLMENTLFSFLNF